MSDREWLRILDVLAEHPEGMTWEQMCAALGWTLSKFSNLFYHIWGVCAYVRPTWAAPGDWKENTAVWSLNDYGWAERQRPVQERMF